MLIIYKWSDGLSLSCLRECREYSRSGLRLELHSSFHIGTDSFRMSHVEVSTDTRRRTFHPAAKRPISFSAKPRSDPRLAVRLPVSITRVGEAPRLNESIRNITRNCDLKFEAGHMGSARYSEYYAPNSTLSFNSFGISSIMLTTYVVRKTTR